MQKIPHLPGPGILTQLPCYVLGRNHGTFANPGAECRNLLLPNFGIHILGPERPGATLARTRRVNCAALILEKTTRPSKIFEMEPAIGFIAVFLGKSARRDAQVGSHPLPIPLRQIHKSVSIAGNTALAGALTLEAIAVKNFARLFFHRPYCTLHIILSEAKNLGI